MALCVDALTGLKRLFERMKFSNEIMGGRVERLNSIEGILQGKWS